jgi:hypothetical protein
MNKNNLFKNYNNSSEIIKQKNWGLGIGDWGLGVGAKTQNPKPQTQNPNFFKKY